MVGQMVCYLSKIIRSIQLRNVESKRERREFEFTQKSLYSEKMLETKLEDEILKEVERMESSPTAVTIHIRVSDRAMAFADTVLDRLGLEYSHCAEPNEYLIQRRDEVFLE